MGAFVSDIFLAYSESSVGCKVSYKMSSHRVTLVPFVT